MRTICKGEAFTLENGMVLVAKRDIKPACIPLVAFEFEGGIDVEADDIRAGLLDGLRSAAFARMMETA
jgi:hypothetical protein